MVTAYWKSLDFKSHDWSLSVLASEGCCNKVPLTAWLKTKEMYCLKLWRLEVQNQSVSQAILWKKLLGENHSLPFPSFCYWLSILDISWLVGASFHNLLPLPHVILPVCLCLYMEFLSLCLNFPLLVRAPRAQPTPALHFNIANYICNSTISK